ncbi:MAG: outer membrane protein assembly factor BamD [Planctomycetota bacterium]
MRSFRPINSRATTSASLQGTVIWFCIVLCAWSPPLTLRTHAQVDFKLSADDRWVVPEDTDPNSPNSQLHQAQLALARGDAARAYNLSTGWLDRYPANPLRAHALLLKADAMLAQGDEYKALYDYEELIRNYPGSDVFVTALQREFQIAKAYANGLRRKFFNTFRWLNADEEAQEILIRVQERLPGSQLAEQAGMELADFYFRKRDLQLASDAYDLFVQNYPRSKQVEKARLRLIYTLLAAYKGPLYDARGLFEASARLKELQALDPITAQRVGADALIIRIYESEASKLLSEAAWYDAQNDPISAELYIRRLVEKYPKSIATLIALREVPQLYAKLPPLVAKSTPDYRTLRKEMLGLDWEQALPESTDLKPAPLGPPQENTMPGENASPASPP